MIVRAQIKFFERGRVFLKALLFCHLLKSSLCKTFQIFYIYDKKIFFSNNINTPGGLPGGAWRDMGAKLMEAIDGALDNVVHKLMS